MFRQFLHISQYIKYIKQSTLNRAPFRASQKHSKLNNKSYRTTLILLICLSGNFSIASILKCVHLATHVLAHLCNVAPNDLEKTHSVENFMMIQSKSELMIS